MIITFCHTTGAEQTLDRLLQEKTELGRWRYRAPPGHQLVSAVCVQIKGDIQYNLGQWVDGAKLLLQSITLFRTLPKMDKKGLSSSLGILAKCFQNMSLAEYGALAPSFGLHAGHPLLEAYDCTKEAARLSRYTPLFVARHTVSANHGLLLELASGLSWDRKSVWVRGWTREGAFLGSHAVVSDRIE